MRTFLLYFGLSGLAVTLPALFAVWLWRVDFRPVLEVVSRIRRHPIAVQLFLAAFAVRLIVFAAVKTNANGHVEGGATNGPTALPPPMMMLAGEMPTVFGFTSNQLAAGFVLSRVDAAGSCSFAPPPGASVVEAWRLRGAADDWARCPASASFPGGSVVFADGRVQDSLRNPTAAFSPFRTTLGVVPAANWPLIAGSGAESMVWHATTPSNSVVVTWRDVLFGRCTNTPVSVQAEFFENGDFDYRYGLESVKCKVESGELGVADLTNVVVGASLGGMPCQMPLADIVADSSLSILNSPFSICFRALVPEDAVVADRDGDGISTHDEIFTYHTDPGLFDSDGDGIADGDEVAAGMNPRTRDSDGDGFSDGTDPSPTSADAWTDSDGDGLPDTWKAAWFGPDATVSLSADANGDGLSNIASLLCGVNPVAAPPAGFAYPNGASAAYLNAWELFPTAFSFQRPAGLSELAVRTFAVRRTSLWEQFYVSSRPDGAGGWTSSDVAVSYGLDGGPATNAVPASASDSWRLPLGSAMPQTVSFVVSATGQSPSLSSPLYLLRWAPGVGFSPSERLAVVEDSDGRTWAAAKRDKESGVYEVPFAADLSRIPHHGGAEAAVIADLALPPAAGLSVTNGEGRAFLALDPLLADLPRVGTNMAVRLVLYSVEVERPGAVSPGPRESRYASPYPLTSSSLRKSFHRASGEAPDGTVRLTVLPEAEGVGYALVEGAVRRSTTLLPPAKVMPEIGGEPCTNDVYDIEGDAPDGYDPTPPEDDDPEGGEEDDCDCGDGGPSLGSFRFRVPLGESASDEHLGFLWAVDDGPAAVTPAKFSVLAAPGVAVVTNADGTLSIDASSLGGRTVAVTNIPHGVAIPVWNASGRFEHEWRIFNEGGDPSRIRVRRVTVLGNATMDETYSTWDEDEPEIFWGLSGPAAAWGREDNIRGVAVTRYEWRDADEPDFVVGEHDETRLGGEVVRSEMRTYEKVGAGSLARRRLSCVFGYDEHGWYEEARTYWHDADHPERNARLRSVQSDKRSWAYFDYDSLGRETLRIEQFDGSPFPELAEVSASAPLPDGCMATVTVTSYDPPDGDDAHRNDSFEPREVSVYIRRGSEPPVMVSHEVRVYTRETDAAGNPLRRIVKTMGFGGLARTETTVEYPQDSIVPGHLRGLPVMETSPDCTISETAYMLSGSRLVATTRRYGPPANSPTPPLTNSPTPLPTYTVTVSDAAYRLPFREETRLTATGAVLEWSERAYDDIHRLRSVTYSDGTSETNAYSCCRLLWRRDRQGRKTLRSAQTGTDLLYYAEEEVWLGEVKSVKCKMENDGGLATNGFRVTRHYFDGLGRETNTVTHLGLVPGEASSMSSPYVHHPSYTSQKTTIYSSDTYAGVDGRGLETYGYSGRSAEGEGSYENVYGESGGEPFFRDTSTFRRRNGGTAVETRWGDKWRCEATVPDYLADGRRVEYATTESSDHGVVTNSISTYDLLGRLSTVATPGPNGSWLVASNAYDGASTRMLSTTQHATGLGPRTTAIVYNDHGEQVGTALDGVTNRADVSYAQVSNEWWRVETATVAGPATNSIRIVMTQLTGLSDACRRHEIELVGASVPLARRTETLVTYDPAEDIETETVTSSVAPTVVRRYRHGVLLSAETGGTTTFSSYDAFGRVAETSRTVGNSSPLPVQAFDYASCGDLLAMHTYTNETGAITESYAYDMQGNRTATTNALGDVVLRSYDPFGRVVSEDGATYPVRCTYDTEDRRTSLSTTRDGTVWDTTTWAYDAATGNCLSKTYADDSTVTYTYTSDNLPLRTTYASGRWKENVYDEKRQVTGVMYYGDEIVSLSYDAFGNEIAASNEVSSVASLRSEQGDCTNETVVVSGGRSSSTAADETLTISRTFDAHRRLTGIDGTTYAYDADGLLASVSNDIAVADYTYTPDRLDSGYTLTLSNGVVFSRNLVRDDSRRSLVTGIANIGGDTAAESLAYAYDALNRSTSRNGDTFGYNARSEVTTATITGGSPSPATAHYDYDDIGNAVASVFNSTTNIYTANNLNQYTSILRPSASLREITHDADGNMMGDSIFSFTYDAASRLKTVSSNGVLLVTNFYDAKSRRVKKVTSEATTTFFYDDWNLIEERVTYTNGTSSTIHYYWGKDLSGTLQGAGGVGGLLYLTVSNSSTQQLYIPCYDNNGNITRYLDSDGNTVAQYTYDAFGNFISKSGTLADSFRHRFSTKYFDAETGLCYYGCRFYSPSLIRWTNRDPIEEEGGLNLYGFCQNNPVKQFDANGEKVGRLHVDAFFNDVKGRLPVRIAKYVLVALRELKRLAPGMYHYRVAFIARFTPPPEVDSRRIKQSGLSRALFGDANIALGGERGMYTPKRGNGDIPNDAWGEADSSNFGFGGIHYRYNTKLFQFGYFVYKQSNGKGEYVSIDHNTDMYASWSVGGATRLLPPQDMSVSGDMNECDVIEIHYGDRGFKPGVLKIRPNY